MAAGQSWYHGLTRAEVENWVALGLREGTRREGFLSSLFCKNNKRQQILFQGTNEVRDHFQRNHDRPEAMEEPLAAVAEEIGRALAVVEETMDQAGATARAGGCRAEAKLWLKCRVKQMSNIFVLSVERREN